MKRKVPVEQLQVGMYVSDLDRPWLGSPFLFQGFLVDSRDELARLREYCHYVYVDEARSRINAGTARARPKAPPPDGSANDNDGKPELADSGSFLRSLKPAVEARMATRQYVEEVFRDIRLGNGANTARAKKVVGQMVDTVASHPGAAFWLTNLRDRRHYTAVHSVNVCVLAIAFARHLGYPRQDQLDIGTGALLHDIGKLRTPPEILERQGTLSPEEFEIVKRHPLDGYNLLKGSSDLAPLSLDIVRYHHERLNGEGYPDGLKGDEIDTRILVVGLVDVFDAIASDRGHRRAVSPQHTLTMMNHMAPEGFGRELMEEYVNCIGIYPVGSLVRLNNESVGVVVSSNPERRLRPIVMLLRDRQNRPYASRPLLDLASVSAQYAQRRVFISDVVSAEEVGIRSGELGLEDLLT